MSDKNSFGGAGHLEAPDMGSQLCFRPLRRSARSTGCRALGGFALNGNEQQRSEIGELSKPGAG